MPALPSAGQVWNCTSSFWNAFCGLDGWRVSTACLPVIKDRKHCRTYEDMNEVRSPTWSDVYISNIFKQKPDRAQPFSHGRRSVFYTDFGKLLSNRRSILATLSSLFTGQWRRDSRSSNNEGASHWLEKKTSERLDERLNWAWRLFYFILFSESVS